MWNCWSVLVGLCFWCWVWEWNRFCWSGMGFVVVLLVVVWFGFLVGVGWLVGECVWLYLFWDVWVVVGVVFLICNWYWWWVWMRCCWVVCGCVGVRLGCCIGGFGEVVWWYVVWVLLIGFGGLFLLVCGSWCFGCCVGNGCLGVDVCFCCWRWWGCWVWLVVFGIIVLDVFVLILGSGVVVIWCDWLVVVLWNCWFLCCWFCYWIGYVWWWCCCDGWVCWLFFLGRIVGRWMCGCGGSLVWSWDWGWLFCLVWYLVLLLFLVWCRFGCFVVCWVVGENLVVCSWFVLWNFCWCWSLLFLGCRWYSVLGFWFVLVDVFRCGCWWLVVGLGRLVCLRYWVVCWGWVVWCCCWVWIGCCWVICWRFGWLLVCLCWGIGGLVLGWGSFSCSCLVIGFGFLFGCCSSGCCVVGVVGVVVCFFVRWFCVCLLCVICFVE